MSPLHNTNSDDGSGSKRRFSPALFVVGIVIAGAVVAYVLVQYLLPPQ